MIELKTDILSKSSGQDYYLKAAKYIGIKDLIHGLFDITQATKARGKYTHLLKKLKDVKLIDSVPGGINDLIKHKKLKDRIPILNGLRECGIIYIQPKGEGENIINFSQFSSAIKTNTDELSIRFTKSLDKWMNKAGE